MFNKKHYNMITVDYYSYYFEIDPLYCTSTSAIVTNLKNHLPYYSHSNGKAEAAVKIVKTLLQKVQCLKLNFYEALLVWRITPTGGVNASPSQQNFSQCTKTKLPTTKKLLVPDVSRCV